MLKHLPEAIPEHISEVDRLVRCEGKTLRAVIAGALYELKYGTAGLGYTYELTEKRANPPQQVVVLLDDNLDIIPVSRSDPDNTLEPENVHMIVEVMLNVHRQSGK